MKKLLLILSLYIFYVNSFCQNNWDLVTSVGKNNFFDLRGIINEDYYNTKYTSGFASSFKLGYYPKIEGFLKSRFEFGVEMYEGKYFDSYISKEPPNSWSGIITVTTLSLAYYPINLSFFKNFEWNLGIQSSFFNVSSKSRVVNSGVTSGAEGYYWFKKSFNGGRVSFPVRFGINNRLAYNIKVNEVWSVQPQINYHFGLVYEMQLEIPSPLKSMRTYFGVGISRDFRVSYKMKHND